LVRYSGRNRITAFPPTAKFYTEDINVTLFDLQRNIEEELVRDGNVNYISAWNSDGSQLVINSSRDGAIAPYLVDVTGTINEKKLMTSPYDCHVTSWSKDGKRLIYIERLPYGKMRLGSLSIDGSERKTTLLTPEDVSEKSGYLSPDGLWLAYVSFQEGESEVYIRNMDGSIKEKVSRAGGDEPAWSPDGTKLFYMNKEGTALLSVEVKPGAGLELGSERVVFEEPAGFEFLKHGLATLYRASYDVHPDGQRFLFIVKKKTERKMKVRVILNWFEELKRKMPGERE
jgi:Tol biopolymer transport system component